MKSVDKPTSNDQFTGFVPDLLFELSRRLNFIYTLYDVNGYGDYNSDTGRWTGMMAEVICGDKVRFFLFV